MPGCWNTSAFFTSRRRSSRMLLSNDVRVVAVLFAALVAASGQAQPDLQGMYTRNGVVGLEAQPPENPIDPSGKNPLSVSNRGDGLGPYPGIFGQGGTVLRAGQARQQRRTGIVDPEDRKLPWKPDEDAKRR